MFQLKYTQHEHSFPCHITTDGEKKGVDRSSTVVARDPANEGEYLLYPCLCVYKIPGTIFSNSLFPSFREQSLNVLTLVLNGFSMTDSPQ